MLQLPFAEKHYHTSRGRHADIKRVEASPCGPTDLVDAKLAFRWKPSQILEASYEQFSGSNGWAVAAELLYGRAKLCYRATAGTTA